MIFDILKYLRYSLKRAMVSIIVYFLDVTRFPQNAIMCLSLTCELSTQERRY